MSGPEDSGCGKAGIGIFGGTFNPIHYGHLRAAEEAREKIGLGKILFIPSWNPPLKENGLVSAEQRYEMARLAIAANPLFDISDIECRKPGRSYTVDTLLLLKDIYPMEKSCLILGIDAFMDIPAWYQPERLMELTDFVIISRPGYSFADLPAITTTPAGVLSDLDAGRLDTYEAQLRTGRKAFLVNVMPLNISATVIRRRVKEDRSIKYLLPEAVESYIISNKLYK